MKSNCLKDPKFSIVIALVGLFCLVFGVIGFNMLPEEEHNLVRAVGFISGFGLSFLVIGVFFLIRGKVISPETKKRDEIERLDERNILIGQRVAKIGLYMSMAVFAVLSFVTLILGYTTASFMIVGGIIIVALTELIARAVISRKI